MKRLIVGMSGSSGVVYGIRMLEVLQRAPEVETHLVMSPHAKLNIEIETNHTAKSVERLADVVHSFRDQAAPISSGSFRTDGMIVSPCSMKTLSAIVHSFADSLLADHGAAGRRRDDSALARLDDETVVETLIADGADVGAADAQGLTPIHVAAERGTEWAMKILLAHGADPTTPDGYRATPLHRAASTVVA